MNKHQKINLFEIFSRFIILRRDVASLKKKILKLKKDSVIFDFNRIEFISRSAIHEIILTKKELEDHSIEIVFENMSVDIEKSIEKVKNTKKKKEKIKLKKINFRELIEGM